MRTEYILGELKDNEALPDPLELFSKWFENVASASVKDYNAMILSTVGEDGYPDSRVVLLKEYSSSGFVFFTNYESKKGRDIENSTTVNILFYWKEFEQQVRIRGNAIRVSKEISDEYFNSRPFESRLSAIASNQSEIVSSRDEMLKIFEKVKYANKSKKLKRPGYWGGFNIIPFEYEFWQGRPGRFHDRIRYSKVGEVWEINRLFP